MSANPLFIDNINFAKKREHLAGSLGLADCTRLAELLAAQMPAAAKKYDMQANIVYSLDGEVNALGQPFLHLSLKVTLTTYCQRCLEKMPLDFNLHFDYLITDKVGDASDLEAIEDSDDYDLQEASQSMDLKALIEDEVIMALPIAPVHEVDCAHGKMQSGEKPNPFAVLKGLIKS